MSTKAIEEALDLLEQLTARKSTWNTIQEAKAELKALQEQVATARDTALEEAAKVADADAIMDDEGEREASLRGATEVSVRFKCRAIAVRGVAEGIRAIKRSG